MQITQRRNPKVDVGGKGPRHSILNLCNLRNLRKKNRTTWSGVGGSRTPGSPRVGHSKRSAVTGSTLVARSAGM